MRPDIIPIVIGVSLCSASAVLFYIWYKTKDREDDTSNPPAVTTTKNTKFECVVPNNVVPLVVGRSGANIKSIEAKTNTQIKFKAKDENNQICEIIGKLDNVKKAAELINVMALPPRHLTEEILVPQTVYGKIVGRCGEALQEICRKSQAKVHIDSGDRNEGEMRRLCITGTVAHVNMAKQLIEEKVRLDEESRNNLEVKREPRGNVKPVVEPEPVSTNTTLKADTIVQPTREKLPSNTIDGQLEVFVSAVASPSRFWIQLHGKQSKELDQLTVSMTDYYETANNKSLHKIDDPYLGQIVAAMFKYDSKWYRAEIVGILPNDYNPRDVILDLYFVDFGDSEYVHPNEVFELRTDFLTLRFQAIECFLANVKPKSDDDIWDQAAISRFEDLTHVARWKKMTARVVTTKERKYGEKREGSPIPGVQIFNADTPDVNIADKLLAEGLADPLTSNKSNENHRNENVLRLDGGDDRFDSTSTTKTVGTHNLETDKFSDAAKTFNGNKERIEDIKKNSSSSFIDMERRNGNKVTSENDVQVVDRNSNSNSNLSYTVT